MTMPDLWTVFASPSVDLLGWTLLHFVWQGALVAALLAGALYLLQTHTPRARYAVGCIALFGLIAMPVGTTLLLEESGDPETAPHAGPVVVESIANETKLSPSLEPGQGEVVPSAALGWQEQVSAWVQPALPWIVLAWGLGVIGCAGRLVGGAWRVRRVRRSSAVVLGEWRDRLDVLVRRMGLRHAVGLRRSPHVDSPTVSGWWRPVILVPAGLLSGLPPEQVEALLLHELAHVRRHDVLVGYLQAAVETLLFFHPATWWISQKVREEREACCDDLAVQSGPDRVVYARALTAFAEQVATGRGPAWGMAASGGSLLARIRRLLSAPASPSRTGHRLSLVAAVLLVVGVPLGLAACASQQSTTEAEEQVRIEREESTNEARSTETSDGTAVVVQDDSTASTIQIEPDGWGAVDSLDGDVYVFRHDGRADTIDLQGPELGDWDRSLEPPFDADSLERTLRERINPDSLERAIRARLNPDSLERAIRLRFDPDSLRRTFRQRFDPDSFRQQIQGVRQSALRADSLAHWHGQHADSLRRRMEQIRKQMQQQSPERLREQAQRLRRQAERMEERAEEMEAPAAPNDPDASREERRLPK